MSTPLQTVVQNTTAMPDWPKRLVNNAVAGFAQKYLRGHDAIIDSLAFPALADRLSERLSERSAQDGLTWHETLEHLEQFPPPLGTPLQRLIGDLELQVPDIFLLALCGEVEQSHELNMLVAALQSPDEGSRPTLHLVSAILREQFNLDLPPGRLHQHLLIRSGLLACHGDQPLPLRTLSIDPEIWNLLNGHAVHWRGIHAIHTNSELPLIEGLTATISSLAVQIASGQSQGVVVRGDAESGRAGMAKLAQQLKLSPIRVELERWQATPLIAAACRYAGWLPIIETMLAPAEQLRLKTHAPFATPIAILTGNDGAILNNELIQVTLPMPNAEQRSALWQSLLQENPESDPDLTRIAQSSLLDAQRIQEVARQVNDRLWPSDFPAGRKIAETRKHIGTHKLKTLAHIVDRHVDAESLVLSPSQQARFDALVQRCTQRERLWDQLGSTLNNTRGSGVRALFSGDSGTGKTLAASRLATCLHAPLFRLDMASVMNKYIGETEKNLSAMLDEAAATDVVLLLDEADALFGKRSEGDSGGERFANMLTNFLLTRIESHPGIVVLTSNSRLRMDDAFTRRFDTVIEFNPPGFEERLRLWKNHLGDRSPGEEQMALLASYSDLSGGYVRNCVLNAAALQPVEQGLELQMPVLIAALHEEYRKLGRALPPALEQIRETTHG